MIEKKDNFYIITPQENSEKIKKGNEDSFTYYLDQGGKSAQEDTVVFSEISSQIVGDLSPEQIGERLFTAHRNLDEDEVVIKNDNQGTTASTTVYDGKGSLITATLGDAVSFAAVYDKDNNLLGVMRLNSVVHSPSKISEQNRIKKAGGTVHSGRVNGIIAVSRAIGDHWGKKIEGNNNLILSSESAIDIHSVDDILKHISTKENKINQDQVGKIQIISASDGLTDGMLSHKQDNNEKNLKNWIIQIDDYQKKNELEFAESLVNKAKEKDTTFSMKRDNTSVVIHTISFENKESKEKPVLMGVYDGHGGSVISSHVANNIGNKFKEQCSLTQENYLNQQFTQTKYLETISYVNENTENLNAYEGSIENQTSIDTSNSQNEEKKEINQIVPVRSASLTLKLCMGVFASLVGSAAIIIGTLAVAAVLTAIAPPIGIAMIVGGAAALLTGVGLFGNTALTYKENKMLNENNKNDSMLKN